MSYRAFRQYRASPLGDGPAEAHINGVKLYLFEFAASIVASGHHALPKYRVGGKSPGATTGTGVEVVPWGLIKAQVEPTVRLIRQPQDALILEDKIAQAVKDGPVLIYFDAAKKMRPMTGEQSAALIDGPVRKIHQKLGRSYPGSPVEIASGAILMAMHAVYNPVGQLLGSSYPLGYTFPVGFIDRSAHGKLFAQNELVLQELKL